MATKQAEAVASVRVRIVPDDDPDLSWLEQDCMNEATDTHAAGWGLRRIAAYGQSWACVGVIVETLCDHGGIIRDASLWGIDHDGTYSAHKYLWTLAAELAFEIGASLDDAEWCEQ